MKYVKYLLYCLLVCFLLVLEVNASTEDIYTFDNLTTSKTIENGSKLVMGDSYPSSMKLSYSNGEINLEKNTTYTIGNGLNSNICYSFDRIENNTVYLSNTICKDVVKPSSTNGYKVSYDANVRWYRTNNVDIEGNYDLSNSVYKVSNGDMKISFKANKGETLYLKVKSYLTNDASYELYLDGTLLEVDTDSYLFKRNYINIENDGDHTLEVKYNGNDSSYLLFRDIRVLSLINEDSSLDTTGLKNRDSIYYEIFDSSVISEGTISYFNNVLEGDPFVGDNQETVDSIYIIGAVFIAILFSLGFSIYKVNKTRRYEIGSK